MLGRAFSTLGRNISLLVIPVAMDLASFLAGFVMAGFIGESKITFKFSINAGLPSISHVLEQNAMASGFNLDQGFGTPGIAVLVFVVFWLIGSFVEAGFVGVLYDVVRRDQAAGIQNFISYATGFWLRFFVLRLLVFVVILGGAFVALPFQIIGVLAFLILFLVLRIKYIYWEFTIVSENLGLAEAFRRSSEHYSNRPPELAGILIVMLVFNMLAGLIFNGLWHPVVILAGIFFYNYVATGLQVALMLSKPGLSGTPVEDLQRD